MHPAAPLAGLLTYPCRCLQTVDTAPPALTSGSVSDLSVPCGSPIPAAPQLTFHDACDADATVTFKEVAVTRDASNGIPLGLAKQLTRTWVASDRAGNNVTVVQVRPQQHAPASLARHFLLFLLRMLRATIYLLRAVGRCEIPQPFAAPITNRASLQRSVSR
jgi:hypothetical protein